MYLTQEKITIYLGLTDRDGEVINRAHVLDHVCKLSESYGPLTIQFAYGVWNGQLEETALITSVRDIDHSQTDGNLHTARWLAEQLASRYNQECCAYEVSPVNFQLTAESATYVRNPR